MAIPKVIGTETEYGISAVGSPEFNPGIASALLISTYAGTLRRVRWGDQQEAPPSGAGYYVDHAHPEYSTPECLSPRELVIHDKAGERILERSLLEVERAMPGGQRLAVYKNNSDGKGNSYGTHENY